MPELLADLLPPPSGARKIKQVAKAAKAVNKLRLAVPAARVAPNPRLSVLVPESPDA